MIRKQWKDLYISLKFLVIFSFIIKEVIQSEKDKFKLKNRLNYYKNWYIVFLKSINEIIQVLGLKYEDIQINNLNKLLVKLKLKNGEVANEKRVLALLKNKYFNKAVEFLNQNEETLYYFFKDLERQCEINDVNLMDVLNLTNSPYKTMILEVLLHFLIEQSIKGNNYSLVYSSNCFKLIITKNNQLKAIFTKKHEDNV